MSAQHTLLQQMQLRQESQDKKPSVFGSYSMTQKQTNQKAAGLFQTYKMLRTGAMIDERDR